MRKRQACDIADDASFPAIRCRLRCHAPCSLAITDLSEISTHTVSAKSTQRRARQASDLGNRGIATLAGPATTRYRHLSTGLLVDSDLRGLVCPGAPIDRPSPADSLTSLVHGRPQQWLVPWTGRNQGAESLLRSLGWRRGTPFNELPLWERDYQLGHATPSFPQVFRDV